MAIDLNKFAKKRVDLSQFSNKPSKLGQQFKKGAKELAQPFIGAGKGILSDISGAAELGQRGLRALTPDFGKKPEITKIPERITERTNLGQKLGFGAEQIAAFAVPLGAAAKATKVAKGLKGAKAALAVGKTALAQGATAGAATAIQKGKADKDALISAGIVGAFPVAGAGLKKLFAPLINKGRLVKKATGISNTLKSQTDDIAKQTIKVKGKTQKAYKSIDDFFIEEGFFKNGVKSTRDDFVGHAQFLLKNAKTSKAALVENIKTKILIKKIPNYKKVLNELDKGFQTLGQDTKLARIRGLINSKSNSILAKDLEFIRGSADDLLFSLTDKPKQEGLRNVIRKFRDILQDVETSGAVKKDNIKIRILSKLLGIGKQTNPLKAAAEKGAKTSIVLDLLGGAGGGVIAGSVPVVGPVLGPAVGAVGAAEAITSATPIASALLNTLSKESGKKLTPSLINAIIKAIASKSATR